jgi:hypothetical protein
MKTTTVLPKLNEILRAGSLLLFGLLAAFWCFKFVYCVRAYFSKGTEGVWDVIVHGMPLLPDPRLWGDLRWESVAVRYGVLAFLTLLLGWANKNALRAFWINLRQRPHSTQRQ